MKQIDVFAGKQVTRRQLLAGSAALGSVFAAAGLTGCGGTASASAVRDIAFWHLLSGGDGIKMQAMIKQAQRGQPRVHGSPHRPGLGPAVLHQAGHGVGRRPAAGSGHHARQPGSRLRPRRTHRPVGHVPAGRARGERRRASHRGSGRRASTNGQVFSIALDSHPFVMFYNTDVAGKAGVLGRQRTAAGRELSAGVPRDGP